MITTRSIAAGVLLLALTGSQASAQQIPGCTSSSEANPPRTVFRCSGGLIIEAEASASFSVSGPRSGGMISAIELKSRGILVELTRRRRFQILTPHAIAAVRRARWGCGDALLARFERSTGNVGGGSDCDAGWKQSRLLRERTCEKGRSHPLRKCC